MSFVRRIALCLFSIAILSLSSIAVLPWGTARLLAADEARKPAARRTARRGQAQRRGLEPERGARGGQARRHRLAESHGPAQARLAHLHAGQDPGRRRAAENCLRPVRSGRARCHRRLEGLARAGVEGRARIRKPGIRVFRGRGHLEHSPEGPRRHARRQEGDSSPGRLPGLQCPELQLSGPVDPPMRLR